MKKLYFTLTAFCALICADLFLFPNAGNNPALFFPSASAADDSRRVSPPYANTFLWKVEKPGAPTSYLLGTLHLGKVNAELSAPLADALAQTIALVTESNVMPEGAELLEISAMMLDMKGSLSATLGQSRFQQLTKLIGPLASPSALEKLKPWAALTLIMYNKPNGYSELFGIDMLLTQRAKQTGKERFFLESIKDAITIFTELPEDKVISLIDILIVHSQDAKRQTEEIIAFYNNHQINELAAIMTDKDKMLMFYPQEEKEFWDRWFNQDLLVKRNTKWMPILEKQLAAQPTLVAVGALHLFGEDGLMEQFQNLGYTLTPVMPY